MALDKSTIKGWLNKTIDAISDFVDDMLEDDSNLKSTSSTKLGKNKRSSNFNAYKSSYKANRGRTTNRYSNSSTSRFTNSSTNNFANSSTNNFANSSTNGFNTQSNNNSNFSSTANSQFKTNNNYNSYTSNPDNSATASSNNSTKETSSKESASADENYIGTIMKANPNRVNRLNHVDQENKENGRLLLKNFLKDYKIFLSYETLVDIEGVDKFINTYGEFLKDNNNPIIVPLEVLNELKLYSKKNPQKCPPGLYVKISRTLRDFAQKGYVAIKGEEKNSNVNILFKNIFGAFAAKHSIAVISNSKNRVKCLEYIKSVVCSGKRVNIAFYYLDENKVLQLHRHIMTKEEKEEVKKILELENVFRQPPFKLYTEVCSIPDKVLSCSECPTENDKVYTEDNKTINLQSLIGSGGEGSIFHTDIPGTVAKIYHKEKTTERRMKKIRLLVEKKMKVPHGICLPSEILFNSKNEFCGYLMPAANGKNIDSIFKVPATVRQSFKFTWNRKHSVAIILNILNKIKFCHDMNIILGDINPYNILINTDDPNEIFFVDTDSYQVEDLPCPVGSGIFIAREIAGKHLSTILRTKGNENFAIATLLFYLLLPCKAPYARCNGGSPETNIKEAEFPYPYNGSSADAVPAGRWLAMWNSLPEYLREAFYNVFHKNGDNFAPEDRLSVKQWIEIFKRYEKDLAASKDVYFISYFTPKQ